MASLVSKRQQAKNEKALQELIGSVPGNNRCADCATPNPGWASWNLGIFLCMRCAALHRKLGTHISKVKSLSMDSWNADQVETMKRVGNTISNRTFNPQNIKPSIPVDMDEADSAIERYVRQKYQYRAFISGSPAKADSFDRNGSISSDDQPPPLPPKPGRKFGFGFRSSSSMMSRSDKMTPPMSPVLGNYSSSSPARTNKQSRVLGSTIGNQDEDYDSKLATLREMGFKDARRNSTVLKSTNGNLDRAVEALVRMGDTNGPPSGTITPRSASSAGNGLTVTKTRPVEHQNGNPFEALDHQPLPQRSATMPVQHTLPPSQPLQNVAATYQQYQPTQADPFSLQTSFQGLHVSQPVQGDGRSLSIGNNPFLSQTAPHSLTYPPPSATPQYQTFSPGAQSSNPFDRSQQSQSPLPMNPWANQASQNPQVAPSNPWLPQQDQLVQTPQAQTPSAYGQNPNQADFFSQPGQQYPAQYSQAPSNPFVTNPQPLMSPSNPFQQPFAAPSAPQNQPPPQFHAQNQPQQQAFPPQQMPATQPGYPMINQQPSAAPFRHDKSSILALYGQPYLPPSQPLQSPSAAGQSAPRSVSMSAAAPSSGSMNPFASQLGGQGPTAAGVNVNGGGAGYTHTSPWG